MTITYTAQVATCKGFGCFLKLLFRWRGSIYKLVWLDLTCFLFLYYSLNITYKFLNPDEKRIFEAIVKYCHVYTNQIPLSFVLGFYVSIVMNRWWGQYTSIPWPDPIAVFVSTNIHGQDERGRVMRRTVMRYVCLCLTMVFTNISPRVKKRFPTLDHLIEAGLLNENEKSIMDDLNEKFPRHSKHWLPIVWAASIITRARKEGRIRDDFAVKTIIDELNKFRGQCGLLISYDTISVPLVYTQVVTLAIYSYFVTSILGQQWVENKKIEEGVYNIVDNYFPIFTTLEFFFYMGWLKVAEQLINPFGEDDDDFEVNWMVDRNLQVSYLIVDEMHHEHPELLKDQYWDEVFPTQLPYTVASVQNKEQEPQPSTTNIEVKKKQAEVIPVSQSTNRLEDMDDNTSGIHFSATRHRTTSGSSNSMHSIAGTMSRVNTVASALKRFLSRDESRTNVTTPEAPTKLPGSASSASLTHRQISHPAGSVRITDQVIEEVDEQMTITSTKGHEPRPNVQSIFQPPPEVPVEYTRSVSNNIPMEAMLPKGGVDALLGVPSSVPSHKDVDQGDSRGEGGELDYNLPVDEFELLKAKREQERLERQQELLARTISTQPAIPHPEQQLDTDLLLENLHTLAADMTAEQQQQQQDKSAGGGDTQL
ncbi:bestrophin-4 isoform X2 [Culicoides brevitarsis]|uniref:bestrophin-4 isoform X2 n=1 Tax=Culicoides brevitarsis TaxID=469753 RepID=UPI00307B1C11